MILVFLDSLYEAVSQKCELFVIPNIVRNLISYNQQLIFSLLYELFMKNTFETVSVGELNFYKKIYITSIYPNNNHTVQIVTLFLF